MTAETTESAQPGRRVNLGKHFWILGVSLVTLLIGAWLMIAPFALGYQPYGAAWADATLVDFWFGLGVVFVSLVALALFAVALLGDLRAAGVVRPRPKPQPVVAPAATEAPSATSPVPDDLERTLATLAAALAADLAERRPPAGAQPASPPAPPAPSRDRHDLRAGAIMFRQPADEGDTTPRREP